MTETIVPLTHPTGLSPSRAADFKTCPLLYRLRCIDRLPEPKTSAATRGTLVHAVLEKLYDLPAAERTHEAAVALLEPEWRRLVASDQALEGLFSSEDELEKWLNSASDLLNSYFTLEDPACVEPAEREKYIEAVLPSGVQLRGVIDRLDVAHTGDIRVVDYKTGTSPGEGYESKALFQLKFYAFLIWKTRGVVPRALRLIYLSNRSVLDYTPDEAELQRFGRTIEAIWAAISRALQNGSFPPNTSTLCKWCSYQAHCPEFGGSPPPFPLASSSN